MISIYDLAPEVLLCILKYCEFSTLCRLRETCKYFNNLVTNNKIFYEDALLTNQINKTLQKRWKTLYHPVDKWRISNNWRAGRYKRNVLCRQRTRYMPYIQLENRHVWVSWGAYIYTHERCQVNAQPRSAQRFSSISASGEDITKFCVRDGVVAVATRLGCVQLDDGRVLARPSGSDAMCIDLSFGSRYAAAGRNDGCVFVWLIDNVNRGFDEQPLLTTNCPGSDPVLCCAWSPSDLLAVGCAGRPTDGRTEVQPLHVWNAEYSRRTWCCSLRRLGRGVLACQWLNASVLVAAGYDSTSCLWDVRCSDRPLATWVEPDGDTLYSLAWDGRHALIGGAARHGRCTLWDLRRPRRYVQMYHAHRPSAASRSSPAYSVAIDAGELFVALDTCLTVLDFASPRAGDSTPVRNYDLAFLQIT